MENLPRGTVTFLFTDIEGSTRLWNEYPEAMLVAYDRHDTILREAVSARGGVVYKTVGDAFQVAFPGAAEAVGAALDAQRALQAETWPLPEPLKVRTALHTGGVDPDAEGDYRSPVLNRLGRLLTAGHGSQVLASQATMELARDRLPSEARVIDLGEQRLRDLFRPEHVYQLVGPGVREDFPSLRTLDARPNNLPTQLTQFIGRQDDVMALLDLLQRDNVRLVTLTGTGGIGKTRLALQVAADALETFRDGVFLVQLDAVTDPSLVPVSIAQALGLRENADVPTATALANHLRDRDILLILDNFEQVVEASPGIGQLLVESPSLKVLATSRVHLRVRGEQEYPVRPLRLPDPRRRADGTSLTQYESVRLFVERAASITPAFVVTNENALAIAEICTRLDGLPLAIELAAARIRMLPPEAMLRRLSARLPLLTGGARDLPARQQTLRGAIAWSYELLSEDEQALFRRMAVFAGGASLEAIEAVAAGEGPGWDIFDGLERLVDQSLVRQSELAGEPRFAMFETIREYGLEELARHGESEVAHRAHAAWFADLARTVSEYTSSSELIAALDRVELELYNIRSACNWTLERDTAMAWRLLAALDNFWRWRSPSRSDRAWVQRVMVADAPDVDERDRMEALGVGASVRIAVFDTPEDVERAWERGEESLRIANGNHVPEQVRRMLSQLGIITLMQGDYTRSLEIFEQGIALSRPVGGFDLIRCLNNAGYTAYLKGDLQRARVYLEEAVALARRGGTIFTISPLNSMADLLRAEGDILQAEAHYAEATLASLETKLFTDVSVNLMGLVITAATTGRWERAAWIAGSIASLRNAGDMAIETQWDVKTLSNDYERAVARTRETLGPEAFARAWSEGAARPLEESVADAVAAAMKVVA